jgi:low affinity Fe/Cu permease
VSARRVGFVMAVVGAVLWAGCDEVDTPHPDAQQAFAELDRAEPDEVVARVGERAVSLEQFQAYWREHPQMEREEVLEALVERELLVAEALERGEAPESLADDRKRAMIRQMLREKVEQEVTVDDLDAEEIAKAVESVSQRAGHPPGLRASHLLVRVPNKIDGKKLSDKKRKPHFERARRALVAILEELPEEATALDLFEARDGFVDQLEEPLELHVNAHLVFPFDAEDFSGELPDSWTPVVSAFRDAAVDMARSGRFGVLSEPVRSQFGWHVIVVEAKLPAGRPDAEAVGEVATFEVLRHRRAERFNELVTEWREDADVRSYPEVISQAESLQE